MLQIILRRAMVEAESPGASGPKIAAIPAEKSPTMAAQRARPSSPFWGSWAYPRQLHAQAVLAVVE